MCEWWTWIAVDQGTDSACITRCDRDFDINASIVSEKEYTQYHRAFQYKSRWSFRLG
eukprot:m.461207 g.461207  ORF g.461207 m.461207 type:complete len:57 (-) comp21599_c0_seq33:1423-1593(-)